MNKVSRLSDKISDIIQAKFKNFLQRFKIIYLFGFNKLITSAENLFVAEVIYILKKLTKITTIFLTCICSLIYAFLIYGITCLPDDADRFSTNETFLYQVSFENNTKAAFSYGTESSFENNSTLKFLRVFPVKHLNNSGNERKYVIPGGELIGINLKTNGVLVVGTECFDSVNGPVNPADNAGIKVGDTLTEINGSRISSNSELSDIIANSEGSPLSLSLIREGKNINVTLKPEISELSGLYKGGLWIRDSTGGIGTLTFTDSINGTFGSLGHGIYDVDTGELIPTECGEIYNAELTDIIKGTTGTAGELRGTFYGNAFGSIDVNSENGVCGKITGKTTESGVIPVAHCDEVSTGYAQIISTVEGNNKAYYDIEIEKINKTSGNKNMVIKITDPYLLSVTGGIVQGMSGSPIIQNGMIIGAVTHVFLNEPTKGYGIFIDNMMNINT